MLIKQANQKGVIFVTIAIFLDKRFKFQSYVCNRYNISLMTSVNLNNIAILTILKVLIIAVLLVELVKVRP